MSLTDNPYTYDLPKEKIAQRPVHPPDAAKLLVVDRRTNTIRDHVFSELPELVAPATHFVFNDTRVIPARLFGQLEPGGAQVEVLLVKQMPVSPGESGPTWECLGRPLKRIRRSHRVVFGATLCGIVVDSSGSDRVTMRFESPSESNVYAEIQRHGSMPIPPYIRGGRGDEQDLHDYQTIFAQTPGSVAAPTASLHFTPQLVQRLRSNECQVSFVTLHVGTASFQPVIVDGVLKPPATEKLHVACETLTHLRASKERFLPILGVGTTVVRAIESAYGSPEGIAEESTSLFITPGYRFACIDQLITNFHQPGTTHLLLVEALLGRDLLHAAYLHALRNDYRFLSYGDAMLIV